ELFSTEQERVWGTDWDDAVYNGVYEITFYAEDKRSYPPYVHSGNLPALKQPLIHTILKKRAR
ncbi:hypothetical protein THIOM_002569, partial [Candidatus Thiomargarita nelsonii]